RAARSTPWPSFGIAQKPAVFRRRLARHKQPATATNSTIIAESCASCHTIRGTPARGEVGSDLTHFASRQTLAAITLPNTPAYARAWLRDSALQARHAHAEAATVPEAGRQARRLPGTVERRLRLPQCSPAAARQPGADGGRDRVPDVGRARLRRRLGGPRRGLLRPVVRRADLVLPRVHLGRTGDRLLHREARLRGARRR